MQFQLTDVPRLLPEIILLLLGLMVLGTDLFERWREDGDVLAERNQAAAQLAAMGLAIAFAVALVQSGYLFLVGEPTGNQLIDVFGNLARNLQSGGPYSSNAATPLLGAFANDHLTMVSRLVFVGAAALTALLAMGRPTLRHPGEFYALLLVATAGLCLMAGASELIMAYVALELSSISLYILAGYTRDDPRAAEAGLKYFLFGAISSGILLYGMSLLYGIAASANQGQEVIGTLFSVIGTSTASIPAGGPMGRVLIMAVVFVVAGMGYKIAVVPFHNWSPDVYQGAPATVIAFVSTASKTAGFILLYRFLTSAVPGVAGSASLATFGGWTALLALLALLTVVGANLAALPQTNAKRLLAYSGVAHAGFALLALLLWGGTAGDHELATSALLYYLVAYSVTNLGAFGALAAAGSDDLRDLDGLARRNLPLAVMLTILVLSLAGVPPLSGFWAKFGVFLAGYQAGAWLVVLVAVLMTVVSLYYYLRFLRAIWINAPADTTPITAPRVMQVAVLIATVLAVLIGLLPAPLWQILQQATIVAR